MYVCMYSYWKHHGCLRPVANSKLKNYVGIDKSQEWELKIEKSQEWELKSPKSRNWKVPRVEIEKSEESELKSPKSRCWKSPKSPKNPI
jgi:hypothetical protein